MRKMKKKSFSAVMKLTVLVVGMTFIFQCLYPVGSVSAAEARSKSPRSRGLATGDILIKDTVTPIIDGVTEHEVITNTEEGNRQKIDYLCEISPDADVEIVAGYGENDASKWSLTPTSKQAVAYENDNPGKTVVAATNGGFFNLATGEPEGALVMEGKVYHQADGLYYFGITKDGKAVIRNDADLSDMQMAIGGHQMLVKDGKIQEDQVANVSWYTSRTAIGIKEDGTILTFVTYGANAPTSHGRNLKENAEMMLGEGCTDVLMLDGGGSATYCARPGGSDKLEVRNTPSDGAERGVGTSILIVSDDQPTGVFDHAQLDPNNEVYTPGSEVKFEARGVDTAGIAMDLPANTKFELAEESKDMGTISPETGVFKAGEEQGAVTVNLTLDGKVVGSTTIELAVPDEIYFNSEEVSLGFEESSDLGVVVRNQKRDLHYNVGDLKWTMSDPAMGSFEGDIFTSSDGNSITGTITAESRWDASIKGSLTVVVGKLPTVVWDFEDPDLTDDESAEDYYLGENGILECSNDEKGAQGTIELATIDNDEPVRFGSNSLKLNYDFTQCGQVTSGVYVGPKINFDIPGTPTGIGVWVYAPEGVAVEWEGDGTTAGFWLRGYIYDGNGTNTPINFTFEPKDPIVQGGQSQPGIYWEGWKYLEADLTNIQAPYEIRSGMTLRLMFVDGIKMGTRTANSIYFDNLQFVYGTNVDDVDEPVIDKIEVNGEELKDGDVITENSIDVTGTFRDVENKYTSGIEESTIRMYLDGVNVTEDEEKWQYAYDLSKGQNFLYDAKLLDGTHSITVSVRDKFGNEASETRYFTVDTNSTEETTRVDVVNLQESAVLGKTIDLQIRATDTTVTENNTMITLSRPFKDFEVRFEDGYEGEFTKSNLTNSVTINAKKKEGTVSTDGVIATLSVTVPSDLIQDSTFVYEVKSGSYTTESGFYATYSMPQKELPVVAPLKIEVDPVLLGEKETVITVKTSEDKPAPNVKVYLVEGDQLIGTTNEAGEVTTDMFGKEAKDYMIYAKDDAGQISFQYKVQTYESQGEEQGMPQNIKFNMVGDPTTQKNISWFSSPLSSEQQAIKYAAEGSDDWITVTAETKQIQFTNGGNKSSDVNSVILTGLKPGTTYTYTVGTEKARSEEATFTTSSGGESSSFFIIPDIQTPNKENLTKIMNSIGQESYDFGIQLGDAIDNATNYDDWAGLNKLFSTETIGDTEVINVMGNHEYEGDSDASISSAIHNNDRVGQGEAYSVEKNGVYVAVINYAPTRTQLQSALDWVKEDAKTTRCQWKILAMHQPPYYTNSVGGNEPVYELVPDVVEDAGFDVVFSGHDHSAGVTNMLTDDQIDEKNGVIYYITGAAGEKRYSVSTDDKFDYATIFDMQPTADYTATYLTVSSNSDEMTINFYDINSGLLHTKTIESKCKQNGHIAIYDPETKTIHCQRCGEKITDYTGEAKDQNDNEYYFINGTMRTGWVSVGEEWSYYGKDGIREKLTKETIQERTCVKDTEVRYTSESGETKEVLLQDAGGHEYEEIDGKNICSVCGHERIKLEECTVQIGIEEYTYTGTARRPIVKLIAPDGHQLTNSGNGRDYDYEYKNNVEIGTATVTLTAARPGKYVNINEWRGNCEGSIDVTYTIHPGRPTNVTLINNRSSAVLSWDKVDSAEEYVIYSSVNGSEFKEIGTTKKTEYTVKGMDSDDSYRFRVGSRTTVDGKAYDSLYKTVPTNVRPVLTMGNRASDGKPMLKWSGIDGATYRVYRSTTGSAGSYKALATISETEYTDVSAVYGKSYYYKVRLYMPDSSSYVDSAPFIGSSVCAQPKVSVSERSDGKPRLTWNRVANAEKYQVYRSTTGENGIYYWLYTGTGTALTNVSVEPGQTYYYKVRAIDGSVKGSLSEPVQFVCAEDTIKVNGTVRESDGKPVITWNKLSSAVKYQVYRSTTGEDGVYYWLYTGTGTKLTNTSAEPGKTYYYKVRPLYASGAKGSLSKPVEITCREVRWELNGSTREDGKPVLTWEKQSGAVKYEVYRSTTGEDGTFDRIFTGTGTKLTNTSAESGETYYYKVRPIYKDGAKGSFSETIEITCKDTRWEIKGDTREDGKPVLTWERQSGAVKYQVYRSLSGRDGTFNRIYTGTGTKLTNTTAEPGRVYYYKVRGVDRNGNVGPFSETEAVECIDVKLDVEKGNRESDGKPTLTWEKRGGAVEYQVYRSTSGEEGTFNLLYTGKGTKFTNTSAEEGVEYYYKVRPVYESGKKGAFSDVIRNSCK